MGTTLLFDHEYDALLDALRRDLRRERDCVQAGGKHRDFHEMNARMAIRLLEVLSARPSIGRVCRPGRDPHRPAQTHGDRRGRAPVTESVESGPEV